jgi:alanine racemase
MSNRHPLSRLVVSLDAVAMNWLFLKKKLKNGSDCAAVVKADAYGLGASAIAQTLFEQGCRHFFVAQLDEALAVKAALPRELIPGNDVSIYVLDGVHGAAADDFTAAGVIPVLNSMSDIGLWQRDGAGAPCVIHIDTGMNRLGLGAADVARLADTGLSGMDVRYVMSHLACGDAPAHPKNAQQLDLFRQLTTALGRPFRLSMANSGGIFLGSDYHFDLARPGASIYGIAPQEGQSNPMQQVVTLETRILQTRDIETGGTVGYGAQYSVTAPAKTATLSIGYADGYMRSLGHRGHVFIGGEKCAVIGRVSMDTIVVDVTALTTPAQAGDTAEIIGRHQTVDDVAAQAGTIGYEVLTALGNRIERTYERS